MTHSSVVWILQDLVIVGPRNESQGMVELWLHGGTRFENILFDILRILLAGPEHVLGPFELIRSVGSSFGIELHLGLFLVRKFMTGNLCLSHLILDSLG